MSARRSREPDASPEEELPLSQKLRAQLGLERGLPGSKEGIFEELRARLGLAGAPAPPRPRREPSVDLRTRLERRLLQGSRMGKAGERNRGLVVLGLVVLALFAAARYVEHKKGG
jgi:hypothetical protein